MAKEEAIEIDGTVTEVLPNTTFRVLLINGHHVLATIAGKMRRVRIRGLAGGRVTPPLFPHQPPPGRITFPPKGRGLRPETRARPPPRGGLPPRAPPKKPHAMHHATSGNLEHRGFGDIDTLTVDEYLARSRWERFKSRVYRHPAVLFGVGAVLHFFVRHRLPTIVPRTWTRERRSILWTDVGLAGFVVLMGTLVGFREFLLVQLPVALLSCSIGVWLFYVQHQFEPTYWEHDERWTYHAAALEGSSYYRLPKLLQWATGNIGLHHIHHLNARIPNYRLQHVLDTYPELQRVATLSLRDSFRCVRLVLWDERARRLVPFPA